MNDPFSQNYSPYYYPPQPPNDSKRSTWILLGITFGALLLCVLGVILLLSNHGVRRGFNRGMYNGCLNQGYREYGKRNYRTAIELYTKAIALDPNKSLGYQERGNAKLELKEYDQAISDYSHGLALLSTARGVDELGDLSMSHADKLRMLPIARSRLMFNLGLAYDGKDDYRRAVLSYSGALKNNPEMIEAYENRADASVHLQQWKPALKDANIVVRRRRNPYAYLLRGYIYLSSGERDSAAADYRMAIDLDPKNVNLYFRLANVYETAHRYRDLASVWKLGIDRMPANADFWANLGWSQYLSGDIRACIDNSRRAISLNPRETDAMFNTGLCYAVLGDWDTAQPMYTHAIAQARRSDLLGAQADIRDALKSNPKSIALARAQALVDAALK